MGRVAFGKEFLRLLHGGVPNYATLASMVYEGISLVVLYRIIHGYQKERLD